MVTAQDASPTPEGAVTDRSEGERFYVASQWRLTWWRFRRHRLAVISGLGVLLLYTVALGADFLATVDPNASEAERGLIPPQPIYWFDGWRPSPHVRRLRGGRDPVTFRRIYVQDTESKIPVRFFARGFEYTFLGFRTDRHLLGVEGAKAEEVLFLLGTDLLGRDLWSRLVLATRISMTIGLVSVAISVGLGVLLGGLSGFYGGWVDTIIQRTIEVLRSIPTIPLWMGLAAAVPRDWSVLQVYFAITVIISLIGWTTLAREIRGRFLSLRDEDFVIAASLAGASQMRVIFHHMVPSMVSHIIASATLAIPLIIISETALSFLGLGIRPPAISWGVLLQAAQSIQAVALSPWLLIPAIPVTLTVLLFNFLGDGFRDAVDPYG